MLFRSLKADAEFKATPIMAVTAYAAKGDEERIRDAGAEGYVSKPISVVNFVAAVAGLLEAAAEPSGEPIEKADGEDEESETASRHSRESGNPPSDGDDGEKMDPGSSPG